MAHRPLTIEHYRQALEQCEKKLEARDWRILNPDGRTYVKVIHRAGELLGQTGWTSLDDKSLNWLKGGTPRTGSDGRGLLGRLGRSNWPAVHRNDRDVRTALKELRDADDSDFPGVAVKTLKKLKRIDDVSHGTVTLLMTLVRPDRLLSLNTRSARGLGNQLDKPRNHRQLTSERIAEVLGEPSNYRGILEWLYRQPWFDDSRPEDPSLGTVWDLRAALVDAFVYRP